MLIKLNNLHKEFSCTLAFLNVIGYILTSDEGKRHSAQTSYLRPLVNSTEALSIQPFHIQKHI